MDADRVWLITGASSGFGRAIAEAAVERGDRVMATSRRLESIELEAGDRVALFPLDVTPADQRAAAIEATLERFGRIDVLVNNAGRTQVGAVEETSDEELTETLHEEVAPFGIHTLIVEPGAFRTGLFRPGAAYESAEMEEYAEMVGPTREYVRGNHLKQPGDPELAARAIVTALDAEEPPLRLVLGADAIGNIRNRLERVSGELADWEELGRATAIEDETAAAS